MEKEKGVMTTNVKIYPGKWPIIAGLWLFAVGVVLFWISFFWGGIAAGGILFLLFMDVSWNVLHGLYANFSPAMLGENSINIFCVTFGPYLIWYLLRNLEERAHA